MTDSGYEPSVQRFIDEANERRAALGKLSDLTVGQSVLTPVNAIPGIVALRTPEGVIVTEDGELFDGQSWCSHRHPVGAYFEVIGGPQDGTHGWYDAHDTCRKLLQVG